MATLQHLGNQQIDEVLRAACERQVPVALTLRGREGGWVNLRSRMLLLRQGHLCLEPPQDDLGQPYELLPADKAGVSFKFKHHKHVFTGTVVGLEDTELPGGAALRALVVCSPTRMHRMQRRAFLRADVPPNRVVRASFWLGGRDAEPAGTSPDCPVWSGRVTNISAGGFQVISSDQGARCLEVGETVGVRIHFGVGEEAVYADAQFRHVQEAEGKLYVGFQFVGLAQTPEGRKTLELISVKAGQFHRESGGAERPRP